MPIVIPETQVKDPRLAKSDWAAMKEGFIIDVAAVKRETDGLLLALNDRFSGRFFRGDGDECDFSWRGLAGLSREEGEVDLFDYFEDGFGDEGAAVEALFDVGPEASIEGF